MADRAAAAFRLLAAASRAGRRAGAALRGPTADDRDPAARLPALADAGSFAGAAAADRPVATRAPPRGARSGAGLPACRWSSGAGAASRLPTAGRGWRAASAWPSARSPPASPSSRPMPAGSGRIAIGAMPLSRAHRAARARSPPSPAPHPGSVVDVVEGSWRELVDPLRDGVIDMMVGALRETPPPGLDQTAAVRRSARGDRRAPGIRWRGMARPTLDQLAAYPGSSDRRRPPLQPSMASAVRRDAPRRPRRSNADR